MLRLGLTGGIGSGKSTVLGMLQAHGCAAVDADAISRSVTAPGGAAIAHIVQQFGADFIASDGSLDRARMRALAFADASAKSRLEAIVHPLVAAEIARQVTDAQTAGRRCVVIDVPLLVESGHWRDRLDRVIVVDCHPSTQLARVMARSGLAPAQVEAIMKAQATRAQRLAAADIVICNEGIDLQQLAAAVAQVAHAFGL
jgi:dephospho-CoA kinase